MSAVAACKTNALAFAVENTAVPLASVALGTPQPAFQLSDITDGAHDLKVAYQGLLPTYPYPFQFPSNRLAVVKDVKLLDPVARRWQASLSAPVRPSSPFW